MAFGAKNAIFKAKLGLKIKFFCLFAFMKRVTFCDAFLKPPGLKMAFCELTMSFLC